MWSQCRYINKKLVQYRISFCGTIWGYKNNIYSLLLVLTYWHSYTISLRIQPAANLRQLAISFPFILNLGTLHEESVHLFPGFNIFDAILIGRLKYPRFGRNHRTPHLLERWNVGISEESGSGSTIDATILNHRLFGEIFVTFDSRLHPFIC